MRQDRAKHLSTTARSFQYRHQTKYSLCIIHICPIHNVSLRSKFEKFVQVVCEIVMFVQLSKLHVLIHLGVPRRVAVLFLVVTSFIDRVMQGIFLMGRHIIPTRPPPGASGFGIPTTLRFSSCIPNRVSCGDQYRRTEEQPELDTAVSSHKISWPLR